MENCPVCGHSFDPLGFQVVIPELGRGFHSIDCARNARALAAPGAVIAAAPLAAVIAPIGLAAAPPVAALRTFGTPAATLGLLAAGTAAAVFLWLRILGADPVGSPIVQAHAPPAAAGETVEALVSPVTAPGGALQGGPTATRADVPQRIVVRAAASGAGKSAGPATEREELRLARRPASRADGNRPQGIGKGKGEGKAKDKGNQGKGLGHVKHRGTNGSHGAGQDKSHGGGSSHSKSKSQGHGNGKKKH